MQGKGNKNDVWLGEKENTVYKYLKGSIREGEGLFTAIERSLTAKACIQEQGKIG